MAGLAATLTKGAMTNSIAELEDAPFIFALGTNTTESHPVIALRIKRAVRRGARLVVADPRRIDLVRFAWRHLPMRAGSNVALVGAMANVILAEGLQDAAFLSERVDGFEAWAAVVRTQTPEWAATITGVPAEAIREVARAYATAERAAICYTLGVTEHHSGTDGVMALGNLALLTGNVGKRGAGVNPFRGQNNVQGTGDAGCMPDKLPGYQSITDPEARSRAAKAWGVAPPSAPGWTKPEVIDAVHRGEVRAMWIVGDNTVAADTNPAATRAALAKLDLCVVQDIFLSETAQCAHVVLPAASGFAETDGVFTNSERRVQRVRRAVAPPGDARPDWAIVQAVAQRMGVPWDYPDAEAVWDEMRTVAPSVAGMSYARLDGVGLQWPCPTEDHPGTGYLHADGFSGGRAHLKPIPWRESHELPDPEYPLLLTTGRRLSTYHTGTQTRRAEGFDRLIDQEYLEIAPADAAALGVADGDRVEVASRRGAVRVRTRITERSPRGTVFMTFHWPELVPTNELSSVALDPVTRTPEFKVCAVRVRRAEPRR